MAERSSAITKPIIMIRLAMIGQPIEIATGPPLFQACANVVKHPDKIEMIEKEIAKLWNPLHLRSNSCLYPSSASFAASASYVLANCIPPKAALTREPCAPWSVVLDR